MVEAGLESEEEPRASKRGGVAQLRRDAPAKTDCAARTPHHQQPLAHHHDAERGRTERV